MRKEQLCILTVGVLLSFFLPVQVSAQDEMTYVRTIYNEQNGLPTGEANTVLQTSDGYLWIGSYGGLIRYDGSSFRNYSTDGLISFSSIRSLFEDSQDGFGSGRMMPVCFCMKTAAMRQKSAPLATS